MPTRIRSAGNLITESTKGGYCCVYLVFSLFYWETTYEYSQLLVGPSCSVPVCKTWMTWYWLVFVLSYIDINTQPQQQCSRRLRYSVLERENTYWPMKKVCSTRTARINTCTIRLATDSLSMLDKTFADCACKRPVSTHTHTNTHTH